NPQGGDTTALIDNVLVFPLPPAVPPTITVQPKSQTVNVGDTVTFSVTAFGSAPLLYQWSKNGIAVTGATNRTLVFQSVVECDSGDYTAVVSNGFGQATTTPASLLVAFRKIAGVFGTGLNADSTLADNGTVDLHYILGSSIDPSFPGPDAIVVTDGQFPIPPWVASGPNSKWIAPQAAQNIGNLDGNYTFQTFINLTGVDLSRFRLSGQWAVDNTGLDILVNGVSTGITSPGFGSLTPFVITSGLVQGTNTLDFVMNNAPPGVNPTGLRVDLAGLIDLRPRIAVTSTGPNQRNIVWGGGCHRLQSAPAVTGPWTTIPGAANPYPVTTTGQMQFFRVAP
ncbi:MAG: immunoglobulin domain-containing protein, partial [Verrucomicrobiota bacterium]